MTMTLADDSIAAAVDIRQQVLQQRVLLLAPTFGCWRGYYQLSEKRVDVKLDDVTIENSDITTPRSILLKNDCPLDSMGKAWKKRFREIENQLAALTQSYSVPFPIRGVRIIPKRRAREFFERLIGPIDTDGNPIPRMEYGRPATLTDQSIAYQLRFAANEFCHNLPSVFEQIRINNPSVWEAVSGRVPATPEEMRDKFYVDAVPIELAGGSSTEISVGDLEDHETIVREACRRKVEEAIETMVAGPREELAEALAGLQEIIARDGRLSNRSFNTVRGAIAKIRLFDFVANDTLLQQIASLEQRLNITTPSTLDSVTAANSGFSAALRSLHAEITSADQQAADIEEFGRERRGLDLG